MFVLKIQRNFNIEFRICYKPNFTNKHSKQFHGLTKVSALNFAFTNSSKMEIEAILHLLGKALWPKCTQKILKAPKKKKIVTKNCSELGGVDLITGLLDDVFKILTSLFFDVVLPLLSS